MHGCANAPVAVHYGIYTRAATLVELEERRVPVPSVSTELRPLVNINIRNNRRRKLERDLFPKC